MALAGRNVLARAKNGTGKTAAFCIPCLERVDPAKTEIQALILVPTRELAMQTAAVLKGLGKHMPGLQVMSLIGGTSMHDDVMRLMAGVHVLVGTPGRILDLAGKGAANLSKCGFVAMVRRRGRGGGWGGGATARMWRGNAASRLWRSRVAT
jgi:ATP-dependent RNA helicase DDX6/DHH1